MQPIILSPTGSESQRSAGNQEEPAPSSRPRLKTRRSWLLLGFALVLGLLAFGAWTWRFPLLRSAAHSWIVDSRPAQSDAIVVLGGGPETRPFAAAKLYREGLAARVLVAQPEIPPSAELNLTRPEADVARDVLLAGGVPASAIQIIGTNVTSTLEEARAVRQWAIDTHPQSVLIPTEIFHTRRAHWIFERELQGTGTDVRVVAIQPRRYQATNWWQHEEGVIDFQNEVIKQGYYWLRY